MTIFHAVIKVEKEGRQNLETKYQTNIWSLANSETSGKCVVGGGRLSGAPCPDKV